MKKPAVAAASIVAAVAIVLALTTGGSDTPGVNSPPVVVKHQAAHVALRGLSSGTTLTSRPGSWTNTPTSFAYRWQRCDSAGTKCADIAGATSSRYLVVSTDGGHTIRVVVTASNAAGSASQTSAATAVVTRTVVTGASQAACSPSACGDGTTPDRTHNLVCPSAGTGCTATTAMKIDNGTGTIENRYYGYYIPANLKHDGSADGNPAAVFDLGRQGGDTNVGPEFADSQIQSVADSGHFIVIEMSYAGAVGSWRHPSTDCSIGGCGMSNAPSDENYVKAVVNDATSRFNIDPARRYLVGGSSGANMVHDVMCDAQETPHNGTLFRGSMSMGGGWQAPLSSTTGICPGGDKQMFFLEIMGKSSSADPYTTTVLPTHKLLGFTDMRDYWQGTYLGNCGGAVHTTTGGGITDIYDYSCADGNSTSPFFEAVAVGNGGHMWCGLDEPNASGKDHLGNQVKTAVPNQNCTTTQANSSNTAKWQTAQFTWSFFARTTTSS